MHFAGVRAGEKESERVSETERGENGNINTKSYCQKYSWGIEMTKKWNGELVAGDYASEMKSYCLLLFLSILLRGSFLAVLKKFLKCFLRISFEFPVAKVSNSSLEQSLLFKVIPDYVCVVKLRKNCSRWKSKGLKFATEKADSLSFSRSW